MPVPYRLTAADYADTGQWRLIMRISTKGMNAFLENTMYPDLPPEQLFSSTWKGKGKELLAHIENAVYDHPRVLDDFAARITIEDADTIFVPTDKINDDDTFAPSFYTELFGGEEKDVMYDTEEEVTAVFRGVAGLKDFLSRTFPGARIDNHLMSLFKDCRQISGCQITIDVREEDADFVLTDSGSLISASTHFINGDNDVAYHLFNIINVYDYDPMKMSVSVAGRKINEKVLEFISGNVKSIKISGNHSK